MPAVPGVRAPVSGGRAAVGLKGRGLSEERTVDTPSLEFMRDLENRYRRASGLPDRSQFQVLSFDFSAFAIQAALDGLGVALVRAPYIADDLREGRLIGAKVTLRGPRMWAFIDRLLNIALPRVRDFRGVSANAFDGRGNYTLGLKDQLVFPEIEYDKIDKLRGMEVTIVTSAKSDDQARALLKLLGMPFSSRKDA